MGPSAERPAGTFVQNYSLASCRNKSIDETPFLFLFYSRKTQKRFKDFCLSKLIPSKI